MSTKFDRLRKSVYDRFDLLWTGSYVTRGMNEEYDPPPDQSWVRVLVVPFTSENAAVGGGMQRTKGSIVVQCFAPVNTGEKELNDMVDEVGVIFQNKNFGDVECFATELVRVGESGSWYQFNANTEFKYDVFS